jgi:hypothetical protein
MGMLLRGEKLKKLPQEPILVASKKNKLI